MKTPFEGGCMCGQARYVCTAEPVMMGNCHCTDCQKFTGAAYFPGTAVPADAITVTGEVKFYEITADSGATVARGFCPECGTSVISTTTSAPSLRILSALTMDDPAQFQPTMNFYCDSMQPWHEARGDLPRFPGAPEFS